MHNPFAFGVLAGVGSFLSILGAYLVYFDGMRLRKLGARLNPPFIAIVILIIQNIVVIQNVFNGVPILPFSYFLTKFSWLVFVLPWIIYLLFFRPHYRKQVMQGNVDDSRLFGLKAWFVLFVFLSVAAFLWQTFVILFTIFAKNL